MYEGSRLGRDRTDERRHWAAVTRLRDVETADEVATVVVSLLEDLLDDPFVYVFTRGQDHGRLEPAARSARELPDVPRLDEGPVWEAFVEGRVEHYPDGAHDVATCELAVPLGVHGVLLVGYTDRPGFTPDEERLVDVVATTAEWRLDAVDSRDRIDAAEHARERAVAAEREADRDYGTLRRFVRQVVTAQSRTAVETALADRLVDLAAVDGATVVGVDAGRESPTVQTRGAPVVTPADGPVPGGPLDEVLTTGGTRRIPDVVDFGGDPSWRRRVLDAGYQSVVALPLCRGVRTVGVVAVFGASTGRFDEASVVDEMVDLATAAVAAFERRESLFAGRDREVEFALSESHDPLFSLARAAGTTLLLREHVPDASGTARFYFESETELSLAALRSEPDVFDAERVDDESARYVVELARSAIVDVLMDEGVALDRVAVADGEGYLVVRVTSATDVRALLDRCAADGAVRLVRQNGVASTITEPSTSSPVGELTDRQREVLYAAHSGGFFDWPRDHTGEELAAELDIAPATFHQHVRTGTGRVFDALFD